MLHFWQKNPNLAPTYYRAGTNTISQPTAIYAFGENRSMASYKTFATSLNENRWNIPAPYTYPQYVQCHKLGKMLSCRTEPKCWRPFSCTVKKLNAVQNRSSGNQFCLRGDKTHSSELKQIKNSITTEMVAYLIFSSNLKIDIYVFSFCLCPAQSNCKNDK